VHTRERVVPVAVRVSTLKGAEAGLYYVEALPSYYLDAGEPAGHWRGDGTLFLGLEGEVDDKAFLNLMAGLDPATGEPLGRPYGEKSVRGFDVTASAPKSVSVLFALRDDATRAAVLDAHDAAVASMVDGIEDHAHTRYRIDGQVAMPTAPRSRPGRYADLDTGQLADAVERAYEGDAALDWELVFELTRRAMAADASDAGESKVHLSRPA
jgi:TrwC relaxase